MSEYEDWKRRLATAARRLEKAKNAPAWLAEAVADSVADAEALAPRAEKDAAPDDFFYPH